MDFLCGVVKNNVYYLEEFVLQAFIDIDADKNLCHTLCHGVLERFGECCKVERGHFERLRD